MAHPRMFRTVLQASALNAIALCVLGYMANCIMEALPTLRYEGRPDDWPEITIAMHVKHFPRHLAINIVIMSLNYRWHIWLESILPARPGRMAGETMLPAANVEDAQHGDDRPKGDTAAQSKPYPVGLSWRNTIEKLILDLTIGNLGRCTLATAFECLRNWEFVGFANFLTNVLVASVLSLIPVAPLAMLISLIIAPARKRIVVEAGLDLIGDIFIGFLFLALIRWGSTQDWVKDIWRDIEAGMASLDVDDLDIKAHQAATPTEIFS